MPSQIDLHCTTVVLISGWVGLGMGWFSFGDVRYGAFECNAISFLGISAACNLDFTEYGDGPF